MRIDSFTRLVLCVVRSASSRSSVCAAFLSTDSTHESSRLYEPPPSCATATSSPYICVLVVCITSSSPIRSASGLSAASRDAMNASRFSRA